MARHPEGVHAGQTVYAKDGELGRVIALIPGPEERCFVRVASRRDPRRTYFVPFTAVEAIGAECLHLSVRTADARRFRREPIPSGSA